MQNGVALSAHGVVVDDHFSAVHSLVPVLARVDETFHAQLVEFVRLYPRSIQVIQAVPQDALARLLLTVICEFSSNQRRVPPILGRDFTDSIFEGKHHIPALHFNDEEFIFIGKHVEHVALEERACDIAV